MSENYNKVVIAVITALIIGSISAAVSQYSKQSTLELRVEYIEKKLDECVTPDKLENAKLQISQQISVHCGK